MKDKEKMVDFDHYAPNLQRVPFPPAEGDYEQAAQNPPPPNASLKSGEVPLPYTQTYTPDAPAPDPSQTTPGAPNIRDPQTPMPSNEEIDALNKSANLKE